MHDREKVIKELEECLSASCRGFRPRQSCPYNDDEWDIMRDALALLKEREAELSYRYAKTITHTATKLDDATCPSCGNVVGEKIRTGATGQSVVQVRWDYCLFCGQKLDWEGR